MADNTLQGVVEELDKFIREVYFLRLADAPPEFPMFTGEGKWPSDGGDFEPFIRRYQKRSIQPAKEKGEGESILGQKIYKGRIKDVYSTRFGTYLSFTYRKMKQGIRKLNSSHDAPNLLADAVRMTMENYYAAILNEADNVTAPQELLTFPGTPLVSAAHPLLAPGLTQSNLIPGITSVTFSAVDQMVTLIARILTEEGYPYPIYRMNRLVVPPEEELNALEVVRSIGRPDTANRADNQISNRVSSGLTNDSVAVSHYMTADRWFGMDQTRMEALRYVLEGPQLSGPITLDQLVEDQTWKTTFWLSRASWDWRGVAMAKRA